MTGLRNEERVTLNVR